MDTKIIHRRGTYEERDAYLELINHVFAPEDNSFFQNLLPKLYKPEDNPAYNAFITFEGDEMRAAVGVFPCEVRICGKTLKGVGVGNVAVHQEHRSRGFMKDLMNMAVDDMVANNVDFSFLGGQRQRYGYFSYDTAGSRFTFYITRTNIRHTYGKEPMKYENIEIIDLAENDNEALDGIMDIITKKPFYHVRSRERLYDILKTWHSNPKILKHEGKFIGYYIGNHIGEFGLVDDDYFESVITTLVNNNGELNITLPPFETKYISKLQPIAEGYKVEQGTCATILCFERVIDAYLTLKSTYTKLIDGEFTALIHGRGGDENLTISVRDNKVTVEATDKTPDIELNHFQAMSFFCLTGSCERYNGPAVADQWFPLPLWIHHVDDV